MGPLVLLSGLALATPASNVAADADEMPFTHQALWDSYLRFYEPDRVPEDGFTAPLCATSLVNALKLQWGEFSPAERAEITAHVAPGLTDLNGPPIGGYGPRHERHPGLGAPPQKQVCQEVYNFRNQVQGDHFSVEWQDGTAGFTQNTAQDFLDKLEFDYTTEIDDLGWRMPDGMDQYLMPIYIDDNPYAAAAYTTIDYYGGPCGGAWTPYIVAESGSFTPYLGDWWQDMSAHEFNHASQFSYGQGIEFWYWEATATYMQEYVYPTHNAWAYYVNGYSEQPWLQMSESNQGDYGLFLHMYGMSIWNFWIDENYGGLPTIQSMWEYSSTRGGYYDLSQSDLLDGVGQDFPEVYKGFTAANTVMAYAEQSSYPPVSIRRDVDDLPAQGESNETAPQSFGQNYIRFNLPVPDPAKPDLDFTFTGDEPANWLVQIVGAGSEEIKTTVEMTVTGSDGEARLPNYGDYGQIFLVISPRKEAAGSFDYSWTADAVEALPSEDPVDTGSPAVAETDGTVETSGAGCGCATGSAPGFAGLGLVIGVIAARRRR